MVKEIKNKRQLKRLCVLPYDLTVDEPSPKNVLHVIEFAKKTGDYLSLSVADIKVIALTYQLQKKLAGIDELRTDPVMAKTIASRNKPAELIERAPLAGFYMPPNADQLQEKLALTKDLVIQSPDAVVAKDDGEPVDDDDNDDDDEEDGEIDDETLQDIIKDLAKVEVSPTSETDDSVVSNTLVAVKEDEHQDDESEGNLLFRW